MDNAVLGIIFTILALLGLGFARERSSRKKAEIKVREFQTEGKISEIRRHNDSENLETLVNEFDTDFPDGDGGSKH